MEKERPKNDTMRTISIVLGVLLLLVLAGMIFYILRSGRLAEDKTMLQTENQAMQSNYQQVTAEKEQVEQDLADARAEMTRMQTQYEEQLRNRDLQVSGLRARTSEIVVLQSRIEELEQMLADYENLQELYTDLLVQNEDLQGQLTVITDRFQVLQDSVAGSHGLRVFNIRALTKWDRWLWADRYNVSLARRVDETIVTFEIGGDIFTIPGNRTIYFNMVNPLGNIMYPSAETFEVIETGESIPYTQMQEVNYTGEPISMEFTVQHPERLNPGTYRIMVYIDGELKRTREIVLE
ncbi:MAG: hypothetical protein EA361_06210 [Bacteroidetes bacterium]|nr:MAG: hypothetical protein EA361_06210 [Bacteroidota bacterium]